VREPSFADRDTKMQSCVRRHNPAEQSEYLLDVALPWAEENMSIGITAQAHQHRQHPIVWLGGKVALTLVAVLLLTPTAAGLESRYAATPSIDSAMSWVFAGE
jgi:hypothetical protein